MMTGLKEEKGLVGVGPCDALMQNSKNEKENVRNLG